MGIRSRFGELEQNLKKFSKSIALAIIGAIVALVLQHWNIIVAQISIETIGFVITGLGLGITIFYVRAIGLDVSDLKKEIEKGFSGVIKAIKESSAHTNPSFNSYDPEKEEEEGEIKTSGAGALAGMIIGGAIGLLGGPIGVLLGGIIGALIGNQLEYEQEKEKKGE